MVFGGCCEWEKASFPSALARYNVIKVPFSVSRHTPIIVYAIYFISFVFDPIFILFKHSSLSLSLCVCDFHLFLKEFLNYNSIIAKYWKWKKRMRIVIQLAGSRNIFRLIYIDSSLLKLVLVSFLFIIYYKGIY